MPPRKRAQSAPVPVVEELDDLNVPVEEDPQEKALAPVPDIDDEVEPEPATNEIEGLLDLLRKDLGILLDEAGLDMCLTVADWYKANRHFYEAVIDTTEDESLEEDEPTEEDLDLEEENDDLDDLDDSDDL